MSSQKLREAQDVEAAAKKRARCSYAKGQGQNGTSRVTRPYPRGPSKGPLSNTQPLAPCGTQGVSQHTCTADLSAEILDNHTCTFSSEATMTMYTCAFSETTMTMHTWVFF